MFLSAEFYRKWNYQVKCHQHYWPCGIITVSKISWVLVRKIGRLKKKIHMYIYFQTWNVIVRPFDFIFSTDSDTILMNRLTQIQYRWTSGIGYSYTDETMELCLKENFHYEIIRVQVECGRNVTQNVSF